MVKLAVVGATGLVGSKILELIEKRQIRYSELSLFSSKRSAGKKLTVNNQTYQVKALSEEYASETYDYVLMSAGGSVSQQYAPIFEKNGAIVIDNSSQFRMDDDIDLVVPEVNKAKLQRKIIANPNCSTIQSVVPLKVLDEAVGVNRVAYTTYQAVSGSGQAGLDDLANGAEGISPSNYPHPIYNNVLPHIDDFLESGYTKEEQKMIDETQKILGKSIKATATCVRVPVEEGHSVHINVSLDKTTDVDEIRQLFDQDKRLVLQDNPSEALYPQSLTAAGTDKIFVGRIRKDETLANTFHIWCSADNLLKGAALNAVQILEQIIANPSK